MKTKSIENINKELESLYNNQKLKEEKTKCILMNQEKIDWEYLLDSRDDNSIKSKILREKLGELNMFHSGYYPEINQYCIKFTVNKNSNLNKIKNNINIILPYIKKFHTGGEICKSISIMENSLGQYGVFHIGICDNNKVNFIKSFYGQEKIEFSGKLIEVLKYIQNNHWFE